MGVKVVATPCFQLTQPTTSNFTNKKRSQNDVAFAFRSLWLGTTTSKLRRSHSFEWNTNAQTPHALPRASSVNFDSFSDEEFHRKIDDLALRFETSDDTAQFESNDESRWFEIEMKAKSVDLPLSLRIIKQKNKQLEDEVVEVSELAYCSIKKAFSSMVFIIRELHSYSLQMREILFYEDMKGILARVRREIHASFVWLFQQVFSHTPTLMVYVMILLANYSVYSMSNSTAVAAVTTTVEEREITATTTVTKLPVSFSSSAGKSAAIGGGNGGGGKPKMVGSGMDGGDGRGDRVESNLHRPILPDEIVTWNKIVDEASRMEGEMNRDGLDGQIFVSPIRAEIDGDDEYEEYFKTELIYQTGLAREPDNVLLLSNYAQFLYLVAHDYDRAEEYFKKAIKVEPKDAEAHNKYANFLWQVRKDLWAAEETFLEAISAEPTNSFYAANYAHFLWNTGGDDTCFPLSSPDNDESLD